MRTAIEDFARISGLDAEEAAVLRRSSEDRADMKSAAEIAENLFISPRSVWLESMTDLAIWLRHERRNRGVIDLGPRSRMWEGRSAPGITATGGGPRMPWREIQHCP